MCNLGANINYLKNILPNDVFIGPTHNGALSGYASCQLYILILIIFLFAYMHRRPWQRTGIFTSNIINGPIDLIDGRKKSA
jgi:hypothetical protein